MKGWTFRYKTQDEQLKKKSFTFWHFKVHIFWEGHKILQNLHQLFVLCTASQKIGGDFTIFCSLLRIYMNFNLTYLVFTYEISAWCVRFLQIAHLTDLELLPVEYSSIRILMQSTQKQWPHPRTDHCVPRKNSKWFASESMYLVRAIRVMDFSNGGYKISKAM